MAKKGYRKILSEHGIKMTYKDSKKRSEGIKCYFDGPDRRGPGAALTVTRKKGAKFEIRLFGFGEWRGYLEKEANILKTILSAFGEASVMR